LTKLTYLELGGNGILPKDCPLKDKSNCIFSD